MINQQSYPIVGGYWTTEFMTVGTHDLVVSAVNETTLWGTDADVTFVELYDGASATKYTPIIKNNKIIFPDYSGDGSTSYLKVQVNTPGVHNIKLEFGSDVSYTSNLAYPVSVVEINDNTANGPTLSQYDQFGSSVTDIGDLDGDGVTDIAVGASHTIPTGDYHGALHILFLNTDGSVKRTIEINSTSTNGPSLSNGDQFGRSVANIGDLDGDGVTDIAVGTAGDSSSRGAINILFLNSTNGSIKETVEVNSATTNGPALSRADFFGSSVANIGDLNGDGVTDIAVGAAGGGHDRGAIHILFLNTNGSVNSTVEVNNSTTNGPTLSNNGAFGSSVANIGDLNGDGVTDIAVGAQQDNAGGTGRGTIHILFLNTDGTIDNTVEINSTTTNGPVLANNDIFGSSVANIGDLNGDGTTDIAVGATGDDAGGTNRGTIHIMFLNTDGSVISTIKIDNSTTNGPTLSNNDIFGSSVANIGDLNGDGTTDIAVGASATHDLSGAIHIINLDVIAPVGNGAVDGTVEINTNTANGPNLGIRDVFGRSVSNLGDLNGDGTIDIAVGASGDNTIHILFMNTDGSLDSTVEIDNSTTNGPTLSSFSAFGTSVANIGDLNGDGVTDIVAGAVNDNVFGTLYILFLNTDGSVKKTVEINNSTTNGPVIDSILNTAYHNFGTSVANIGDLNGDGVTDIAVGMADLLRGALHILFLNTDGSVKKTVEINGTTTNGPVLSQTDYFGISVANIGDLNGDGTTDIAVGARNDDAGGTNRGTIHILFLNSDGSVDNTVEINSNTANGPSLSNAGSFIFDHFGRSVANIGDLNGDGVTDIAVGAQGADTGDTNLGVIHILFLNTDGSVNKTVEINSITTNGPLLANLDSFSSSVTNIGDLNGDGVTDIAVGAFLDDAGGNNFGALHIIYLDKTAVATNVTSTTADGTYAAGSIINIDIGFSESVTVTGTPQMTLETGITDRVANYTSGNNTDTLTFRYTVQEDDTSSDLDYVGINSLTVAGSGSITTTESPHTSATLALPPPSITTLQTIPTGIFGSLAFNQNIIVGSSALLPPELDSAKIDEATGILTLNFNEAIDQDTPATDIDRSKFTITDAGNTTAVSLAGATYTAITNNATAFTLTLNDTQLNTVKSHATPDLDITAGAVTSDATQTPIATSYDNAITILNTDTTKPVFDSATLDLGNGILTINFDKDLDLFPITDINTTAFTITDAANASPVSLAGATYTGISGNTTAFTLTLNSTQFDAVKSHVTPDLDIAAGAVKDISQNPVVASNDNAITLLPDTTSPVFISATLNEGTGQLNIHFNEDIDQSDPADDIIQSRFTITDAGGADAVSLQGATYIAISGDATAFTLNLTSTQLATVKSHVTPELDITTGAVKDTSQNPVISSENNVITAFNKDTTEPVFDSAKIDERTGIITINFNEPIDQDPTSDVNLSGFFIANDPSGVNNIALVNAKNFATVNATAFSVQLTNVLDLNTVRSYVTLYFNFLAGAVKDTSQNPIAAAINLPISQLNTDTTPPTFDSAKLDESTSILTINFNEDIDQTSITDINTTAFTITDTGNTSPISLAGATYTAIQGNTTAFTLTLNNTQLAAVILHTTSDLDIAVGAVKDISQNPIIASNDNTIDVFEVDNTKPVFDSATLNLGTGILTINFNEPINQTTPATDIIQSRFNITDTGNTNVVSLQGATYVAIPNNATAFTLTLNSTQLATVKSHVTPDLDIAAGAVKDISQNPVAASSDNAITVLPDTTSPVFDSATLDEGTGILMINFNEDIDQDPSTDIIQSRFTITDVGGVDSVSLQGAVYAAIPNNATAFTLNLTNTQINTVKSHVTPDLDIAAGAVSDTSQNPIAASENNAITAFNKDTTNPVFDSAKIDERTGIITINFNEPIDQDPTSDVNLSAFSITDSIGGINHITLVNAKDFMTSNATAFTVRLSIAPELNTVRSYVTPYFNLDAGAVKDTSQNPVNGAVDRPISQLNTDTTLPTFDSAKLDEGTGILTINFDEDIDQTPITDINTTAFTITDTGNASPVSLAGATYATISNNATAFTLTLNSTQLTTVILHTTSDLDITSGAVHDISQNPIALSTDNPITVLPDTTKPVFDSAKLDESTGILTINFNEPIEQTTPANDINASKFSVTDTANTTAVSLAGATYAAISNNATAFTLTLNSTQIDTVRSQATPDLDIAAGAIKDTSQNPIATSFDNVITALNADETAPTFVAAVLDEETGVLVITFSERIDQNTPATDINTTAFTITDVNNATPVSLTDATPVAPTDQRSVTLQLTEIQRSAVILHITPDLDIAAGAVTDISQNPVTVSTDSFIIAIPDTTKPALDSVALNESTGVLTLYFNESIKQDTIETDIILSKFNITDTANANPVSLTGTKHTYINTNAFSLTLNNTQLATVISHITSDLDIAAGAVTDVSNNTIAASAENMITVLTDGIKPTLESASFDVHAGVLTLRFNESIKQDTPGTDVILSGFTITDNANTNPVSLTGATYGAINATTFTVTLTDQQHVTVRSHTTPDLDITDGTIRDLSANTIISSENNTITVFADNTKPTLESVVLDEATGVLTLRFDEHVNQTTPATDIILSRFTITDVGDTLPISLADTTYTAINPTTFTLKLDSTQLDTVRSHITPDLDITAGAIRDLSANPIATSANNEISMSNADITPPALNSATLNESTGILTLNFTEPIDQNTPATDIIQSRFIITDAGGSFPVQLTGATYTYINSTAFSLELSQAQLTIVRSHEISDLDIAAGAVTDISQNPVGVSTDNSLTAYNKDTTKPTLSVASLNESTGILTLRFNEDIDQARPDANIIPSRFTITDADDTSPVSLADTTHGRINYTSFSLALDATQLVAVRLHTTPDLDIAEGAVRDTSYNTVAVSVDNRIIMSAADNTKPTLSLATLDEATGILTLKFSEAIHQTTPATDITLSGFTITDVSDTNPVSLADAVYTAINSTTFTLKLNSTQIDTVRSQTTPDLDIADGAIRDLSANTIISSLNNPITASNKDITKPTFTSALLNLVSKTLLINFNEPIDQSTPATDITLSSFTITDTDNTNPVSLADATYNNPSDSLPNTISLNLTNAQFTTIIFHGTSDIDIAAGAVKDISQNPVAASSDGLVRVFSTDTTAPALVSTTIDKKAGILTLNFDELIDQNTPATDIALSGFTITNTTNTLPVSLTGATHFAFPNNSTSIILVLNQTQTDTIILHNASHLDIAAGAVKDIAQNPIAASTDNPISEYTDITKPVFDSATLDELTGVLTINFNEPINQVDISKFNITNANDSSSVLPLVGTTYTYVSGNSAAFSVELTPAQLATVMSYATSLNLDIAAGAVRDISNNTIAASKGNSISVLNDDVIPPVLSSATLDEFTGVLTLDFNEPIDQNTRATDIILSRFTITDANNTNPVSLKDAADIPINATAFTITLNSTQIDIVRSQVTPDLDIAAGAVKDISQNPVATSFDNVITALNADEIAPTFVAAVLVEETGVLVITFSERIDQNTPATDINTTAFTITDVNGISPVSLDGATPVAPNDQHTITLQLTEAQRSAVISHTIPDLDIAAGAVKDISQNPVTVSTDSPIVAIPDTAKPVFSSAALDESTGVLTLYFNEPIKQDTLGTDIILSKFNITDTANTNPVSLTGATYDTINTTTFTVILTDQQHVTVRSHTTPDLDIADGAIRDISANPIISSENNPITVYPDNTKPTLKSVALDESTGVLTLRFDEHVNQTTPTTDIIQSSFTITDTADTNPVSLADTVYTAINFTTFSLTLNSAQIDTVRSHTTPDLDIADGAIRDLSANTIISSLNNPITAFNKDITKPTFTSALLNLASKTLLISFNEPIDQSTPATDITLSGFTITDTDNANPVSLADATYNSSASRLNLVELTLTNAQFTTIIFHDTSNIDIAAGAVKDISQNPVAASSDGLVRVFSTDDTPPALVSTTIDKKAGILTLNFDELIDLNTPATDITLSGFTITNTTNTLPVSLTGATHFAFPNNSTSIILVLNQTQTDTIILHNASHLDIVAGAVKDIAQNPIAASTDNLISEYTDITKPVFDSAALDELTSVLTINFNEPIDQVDISKFDITNANDSSLVLPLVGTTYTYVSGNSAAFSVELTPAQLATVMSYATSLNLDIAAGAVRDISNNTIAASKGNSISVLNDDVIPPVLSSATLDEFTGVLALYFNEPIDQNTRATDIILSRFTITDANNTNPVSLKDAADIPINATAFTITLNSTQIDIVRSQVTPDLDIVAGAVKDISQNPITALNDHKITAFNKDTVAPAFESAVLTVQTGFLVINFNETIDQNMPLLDVNASKFTITDTANTNPVSLAGATHAAIQNNSTAFTLILNTTQITTVITHTTPYLDITAGAISDISQNPVATSSNNSILIFRDIIKPVLDSVSLNYGTGLLTINFNELIDQDTPATDINTTAFTITDANNTSPVSLAGATYATIPNNSTAFTLTLNNTQLVTITSHVTPNLDIAAGAVKDLSQNLIAMTNNSNITDADPTKLKLISVSLDRSKSILLLYFNEEINYNTIMIENFTISDDGKNPINFNRDTETQRISATAFAIKLTESEIVALDSYDMPRIDIKTDAILDQSQNRIGTPITVEFSIPPPPPPLVPVDETRTFTPSPPVRSGGGGGGGGGISSTFIAPRGDMATDIHLNSVSWDCKAGSIRIEAISDFDDVSASIITSEYGHTEAVLSDEQNPSGTFVFTAPMHSDENYIRITLLSLAGRDLASVTESLSLDSCIGKKTYERQTDSQPVADSKIELELEPDMSEEDSVPDKLGDTTSEPEQVAPKYEPEPGVEDEGDKQQPDSTQDTESATDVIIPVPIVGDDGDTGGDDDATGTGTGGACLIATAAYGTELAPQVQLLREIRDGTLMSTASGSSFMAGFNQIYYSFSPGVADLEREHQAFRDAVRMIITPGVYTLNVMSLADGSDLSVLFYGILTMGLLAGMYVAVPVYVTHKIIRKQMCS